MIPQILAFCGTLLGRVAIGGGLVAAYFAWLLLHDHKIREQEKAYVEQHMADAARKLDERGVKARNAVPEPGAFDRLRKSGACLDCGGL